MSLPGLSSRVATVPVVRIHYSADEAKRPGTTAGDTWYEHSVAGYPGGRRGPRWRREMEIDYGAYGGERVFPDWDAWLGLGALVIPPFDVTGWSLFGTYDHGFRRPACYLVHAANFDGDLATVWEFYAPRVPVASTKRILNGQDVTLPDGRRFAGCPYVEGLQWRRADPQLWAEDQPMSDNTMKSIAWLFRQAPDPVHFLPADKGADTMIAEWLLGVWWADPAHPRYRITTACPNLLRELGGLRHKELSAQAALDKDQPEGFVEKDDHAWDALKYFLHRFPPQQREATAKERPATFQWFREQAARSRRGEAVGTFSVGHVQRGLAGG